ncbi:LuxR family transcriptional regulator [Hoeflea sp. G2-23]|uniref:LuxR family transcriptional regulator n=1 Tax=Hoeflea algicola TaxID=2983763 RepID=A0ABT3Z8K6_9HYPH|nr:LuxR family transcriptional regulator [Hoeflea algicola]MCY0148088.1 LuxR family transcriptional regulator [Hoeflea algicola]
MKGQEALFNRLNAIKTEIDLAGFLRELADRFDFKGFMLVNIPAVVDDRLARLIVLSDMPSGLIETYDAIGLLKNSPVFATLRRSTAPVSWNSATINKDRPTSEIDSSRQLFAYHDMTLGVYFPVHGSTGDRAAVGFLGNRPDLTHTELGELGIFVLHAYDVYSCLKNKDQTAPNLLTARELEVLHWAANGKTSTEIAAILSLSDHTVNTYMNSAMRKLDCVNRTQLVAKALRLHLIS